MIRTVWPYLAVMLLCAGLFPALERRYGFRLFSIAPPIVLTYLLVTALAVAGLWEVNDAIREAQSVLISRVLPALLFLLMINCDLRAIFRLGPRVLAVFFCTTASLFIAFLSVAVLFRPVLPAEAWQPLAALSGSWAGGTANMIAVKEAIDMPDSLLAMSLLTDALCYSVWVAILFSIARLAPAWNRWTGARSSADLTVEATKGGGRTTADSVLIWLSLGLLAAAVSAWLARFLPTSNMISATTWTILLATALGLVVGQTPFARYPGASSISGAMLIALVAVLASQSNFHGIGQAPLYILCGVLVIAVHAGLMTVAARLFHFDMYLCGISSLAHIGGVAAAPLLAASYSRSLVPVGVLLALLGYVIGTGYGLLVARLLSSIYGGGELPT
jgi:uncharacterized membrane protein